MDPHRTLPVYEGQKKTISILIPTFLLLFFLSVVLWILSMTARMSKNIHDDHSSFWVSLDDSARLSEWYNDIDVCLLSSPFTSAPTIADYAQDGTRHSGSIRHNKTKTDIQLQRKVLVDLETNWSHRCAKDFRTARKEVPFFCRISNCNLPLFRRHFHLKELNSKLIRSPRKSLIYHLYSLAEAEHALVFIGDTVTKQNVDALFCEVTKLDDSVQLIGNLSSAEHVRIVWNNPKSKTKTSLPLSVYYIPFNGIRVSEDKVSLSNHSKHHGHHRTSLSDLKVKVDQIQMSFSGGITLVASVGSSYYSRMKFRDDIGPILDWLNVIGESTDFVKNRVFFRENAAQHWNSTIYGYQTVDSLSEGHKSGACEPLGDAQNSLDWRNREVYAYMHNEKLHNIQMITFRDVTAPLFNMHATATVDVGHNSHLANTSSTPIDCTNFCFFPQLWQIIWSNLVYGSEAAL